MSYVIVKKETLQIGDELTIPIPMSHSFVCRSQAMRWMFQREMQKECEVMPESKFRALSGFLPKK